MAKVDEHLLKYGRKIIFRQAKHSDTEAIKQLHRQALESVGAFVEPSGKHINRDLDLEDIEAHYLNMGGDFVVGELMGEIVAMCGFRKTQDVAELKRMRVRPDLHGQGIGTMLLEMLEDRAKKQGYKTMVLDTSDKQHIARHLYESRGYHEFRREATPHFVLIYYKKSL